MFCSRAFLLQKITRKFKEGHMAYFRVGTLVNTHGIRGEVKVVVITDFPEKRFAKGEKLILFKDVADTTGGISVTIATAREQKGLFFLTFKHLPNSLTGNNIPVNQ